MKGNLNFYERPSSKHYNYLCNLRSFVTSNEYKLYRQQIIVQYNEFVKYLYKGRNWTDKF